MDRIWAPWRKHYITLKKTKTCIFCLKGKGVAYDKKRHILKRSARSFSLLNTYPYNNAHVMVAPYKHVGSLELLDDATLLDVMQLVNHTKKKIDRELKPIGYNIGINIGRVAGAGFPGHVHVHIVPRWTGDTNFMPVLSEVRLVPVALAETYKKLEVKF